MADELTLSQVARAGFVDLSAGRDLVLSVCASLNCDREWLLAEFSSIGDVDYAASRLRDLIERFPAEVHSLSQSQRAFHRLLLVLGASQGLTDFILRTPSALAVFSAADCSARTQLAYRDALTASVSVHEGVASLGGEEGRDALRRSYRMLLLELTIFDLEAADPLLIVDRVTQALADLAGAALEASLAVARADAINSGYSRDQSAALSFAIIGMGKCGARELNYVSDVDVIFVSETTDAGILSAEAATALGTKIAQLTMRGIFELGAEPGLWEVDANLRPEGKAGALVRTLESHLAYYDRWAKNWEFQALLKARPLAGDRSLGERYVAAVAPLIWSSASREGFVDQVQRMRERVTEHIPADDVEWQLKLGPGGLRDIEFTVQLLQLVHGQADDSIRTRGTLESLEALMNAGYVGREEATSFAQDYRRLRVLEHRLQLRKLSRTHLIPRDGAGQRLLARASQLADSPEQLVALWASTKLSVRNLHERLFYRPLLAAVATLSEDDLKLTSEQAQARLAAIGFRDARAALAHIAALTSGVSRRATIQRALLPIILQWLANGAAPDYGLLAFRRLSEALGETHWYLRLLRDGVAAAERLTSILSGSRFSTDLLEQIPESVAWLDDDEDLKPRSLSLLRAEVQATLDRHDDVESAIKALRMLRRREILRMAMGSIVDVGDMVTTAEGLSSVAQAALGGFLDVAMRDVHNIEFAVIGMGRLGGAELGFGSDADVMFVYRVVAGSDESGAATAAQIVQDLSDFSADARLALELDLDLRPEGKNGPQVRSLDSYAAYYEKWGEVWETQALLRARALAGSQSLIADFVNMIDAIRFQRPVSHDGAREIRRIKARVESERLPQGADPTRHLKLGRGSLSDVEWTVQLMQLQHGYEFANLRTPSTLKALDALVADDLMAEEDAARLREAWILSSRVRSALTLWGSRSHDTLPTDVVELDGIARLLGYAPGKASLLEEDYLRVTRRARAVFDRLFYGQADSTRRN